jgi:hypothetical protein
MYESQGEHEPAPWLSHNCNIIVFTFSGKPVYVRYGSEDLIAGFTGTLQALVSKFAFTGFSDKEDRLRSISLGSLRIEFLNKSPLILVCISRNPFVPHASLHRLLAAVHAQLLFVLTGGINVTLLSRPSFDVRTLLGGTKPLLGNLISWMNRDMLLAISDSAVEPLPLPVSVRSEVIKHLQDDCPGCSMLTLLLSGHRLIATGAGPEYHQLVSASDLILLINLVISSASMRSSESWTPVCLPSLSSDAFVYAYVQYLSADATYVCISLSPDSANFHSISNHAGAVKTKLSTGETLLIDVISEWTSKCPLGMGAVKDSDGSNEKRESINRVRHCAIVLNQSRQVFSSAINLSQGDMSHKDIFRSYQQCVCMLDKCDTTSDSWSQQVSITYKNNFVFVWLTSEFQLFLTAPRGTDVSVITYMYQWLRENEQTLFIPNLSFNGTSGTRIHNKALSLW